MDRPIDEVQGAERKKPGRCCCCCCRDLASVPGSDVPLQRQLCGWECGSDGCFFFFSAPEVSTRLLLVDHLHKNLHSLSVESEISHSNQREEGGNYIFSEAHKQQQDFGLKLFINVRLFLFTVQQHPWPFLSVLACLSRESPQPPITNHHHHHPPLQQTITIINHYTRTFYFQQRHGEMHVFAASVITVFIRGVSTNIY